MACIQFYRRSLAKVPMCGRIVPNVACRTSASTTKDFSEKNKELNRPMSPHITIYSPQWTSGLSILHRGTGIFLSAGVYAAALATFQCAGTFEATIGALTVSPILGGLTKASISFPFVYHSFNGLRHLNWDRGVGYEIKTLEQQGKIVLGTSVLASLLIAFLL